MHAKKSSTNAKCFKDLLVLGPTSSVVALYAIIVLIERSLLFSVFLGNNVKHINL